MKKDVYVDWEQVEGISDIDLAPNFSELCKSVLKVADKDSPRTEWIGMLEDYVSMADNCFGTKGELPKVKMVRV